MIDSLPLEELPSSYPAGEFAVESEPVDWQSALAPVRDAADPDAEPG